jgi:hypothetical protein
MRNKELNRTKPPFWAETVAHRRSCYTSEQRRIQQELNSDGRVGRAFRKLCAAGMDPESFELQLVEMPRYVMKRKHSLWTLRDFQRLNRITKELSKASKELEKFTLLMGFMGIKMKWPVNPLDVPKILRELSGCVDATAKSKLAKEWRKKTAYDKIPELVNSVRKRTGGPHLAEIAVLVGAIYKMKSYSADNIKTIIHRGRSAR